MRFDPRDVADKLRALVPADGPAAHVLDALGAARTDEEYAAAAALLVRLLVGRPATHHATPGGPP